MKWDNLTKTVMNNRIKEEEMVNNNTQPQNENEGLKENGDLITIYNENPQYIMSLLDRTVSRVELIISDIHYNYYKQPSYEVDREIQSERNKYMNYLTIVLSQLDVLEKELGIIENHRHM